MNSIVLYYSLHYSICVTVFQLYTAVPGLLRGKKNHCTVCIVTGSILWYIIFSPSNTLTLSTISGRK